MWPFHIRYFLSRFLWNVSIFFFLVFFVNVHNELLYRNVEAVYALKQRSFVFRATLFDCLKIGIYGKCFYSLYIFGIIVVYSDVLNIHIISACLFQYNPRNSRHINY